MGLTIPNAERGAFDRSLGVGAAVWTALLFVSALGSGVLSAQESQPLPGPPLTLGDVYRLLQGQNQRIEAARLQSQAATERIRPARTLPDPELQLGLMNRNLPGLGLQDPLGMNTIQVMQMVPIAGKLGLAGRVAEAQADASRERASDVSWDYRSRAAMVFYDLYQIDRSIEVEVATQGLLRDIAKTAETMYSVGEGRQADVLRAQVELARMTEDITRMRAMRVAMAARLNALLNRPTDTPIPPPVLPAYPSPLPELDSLELTAMAGRPMLRAGASDLEAAQQAERLARREIWPDLTLGLQYGQRPMVDGTDRMISFMLGFSVPIFAGRRQIPMRRETEAMRLMATADLEAMKAETRGRLGELRADIVRARNLSDLYRTTILPQAQATLTSALASYRVGGVDFMTLLDDQMTVNRYRQELFQLEADEGKALAEMEMLLGRALFDPDVVAASTSRGDDK